MISKLQLELLGSKATFFYCRLKLNFFGWLKKSYFLFEDWSFEKIRSCGRRLLHLRPIFPQATLLYTWASISFAVGLSSHSILKVLDRCQNSSRVHEKWVDVPCWPKFSYFAFLISFPWFFYPVQNNYDIFTFQLDCYWKFFPTTVYSLAFLWPPG